jgi:acetyl esterase/lipase
LGGAASSRLCKTNTIKEKMSNNSYEKHIEKYGDNEYQEGDLYIPGKKPIAVICLFHGGFWRMPYDREQLTPISIDFAEKGFVVWNIEYRRIGADGGGWHGTLDDAIASINHLVLLKEKYDLLDLSKIIIVGHSAGGHLAVWCAKQVESAIAGSVSSIKPYAVVGLAPIIDIEKAFIAGTGNNAVSALLNSSPSEHTERYTLYSPIRMLPIGVRQLIIHGNRDEYLPVEWSRDYVTSSRDAGDSIDYIEIVDGEHMDYLDPNSVATSKLQDWIIKAVNA